MGSFSLWHWLIVLVVVLVLFGRGRVADVMGEFGKGIKSFKSGMNEENSAKSDAASPPPQIPPADSASEQAAKDSTKSTGGQ